MKEDIADKLQKEFEENETAIFYFLLKVGLFFFCLGLLYLYLLEV